jgi:hypothetical protein
MMADEPRANKPAFPVRYIDFSIRPPALAGGSLAQDSAPPA